MPLCAVPGCNVAGVHLFPKDPTLKKSGKRLYDENVLWPPTRVGYAEIIFMSLIM